MATTTSVTRPPGNSAGSTWNNPGNISASDDAYASIPINSHDSVGLIGYNFGFNIPNNATINGIQISVELHGDAPFGSTIYVEPGSWDGNYFTSNASQKQYSGTINTTDTTYSLGSSSDLWNTNFTPSDVNSPQFACQIIFTNNSSYKRYAYVDYVSVTITYTTTGTTWQLTASIPMITTITPNISITKRIISSIVGATSFSGVIKRFASLQASVNGTSVFNSILARFAGLQTFIEGSSVLSPVIKMYRGLEAYINGGSVVSSVANIYKRLVSVISGVTQISPFVAIQKALASTIQSSTSFLADLLIRGKQFLNAIISTSTILVSNLTAQYTLSSALSGETQISSFVSIKKSLQGSFSGRTLFVGTIRRITKLASDITTQTMLSAKLIVPRLLSAIVSGGTSFVGQMQRLRWLTSKVISNTKFQAQLISVQLLRAIISSTTRVSTSLEVYVKMFASFIGSTIFVAVPTFWNKVKKPTAIWRMQASNSGTWQQKNEEVKTWRRIK